ncbi:MAG: phosphatidylserine decarboxylase family protein [Nitrospirae bacterium]|nr:MAG: phosphatidylserine decarboxylase family protein [Nitrospirota bacterium]
MAAPTVLAAVGGWPALSLVFGVLTGFVAWFFRNPARVPPQGEHVVVAPSDGKVIAIVEEEEPPFLKEPSLRISIFLNVFDVHINRLPVAGRVMDVVYQPGQFLTANRPEASMRNEQNALYIETPGRQKVVCVQVAGLVARRIACWVVPGEQVQRGERFGLIRFGSRMDTYLPKNSRLLVRLGQRVKGGETIVAELPCADGS